MPQVASPSANSHAPGQAQAKSQRAAPTSGGDGASPFQDLLDDTSSGTAAPAGDTPAQGGNAGSQTGSTTPATTPAPASADAAGAKPAVTDPTATPAGDTTAATIVAALTGTPLPSKPTGKVDPAKADAKGSDPAKSDGKKADQAQAGSDASATTPPVPTPATVVPVATSAPTAASPAAGTEQQQKSQSVAQISGGASAPAPQGPAVDATAPGGAPAAPVAPAMVAATTAQKLDGLDKGKATAKPGTDGNPAATTDTTDPAAASGTAAQSATDAKPAVVDKSLQPAKPEPPAHHTKNDAAVSVTGTGDGLAGKGTDASGGNASTTAAAFTTGGSNGSGGSSATQAVPANPNMPQTPAVPIAGLAVEIAARAQAGNNSFQIRLDPPELGRIEVKLSVDRQGQVTSHLIADRADTLDLLRKDSSGLERALQDAGLKTAGDGLQFSLRDQSFANQQNNTPRPLATQIITKDDTLPPIDVASGYTRLSGRIGGVDIRV